MDYYKVEHYYSPNAEGRSTWFGRGAAILGLEGPVDPKIFEALLYGRLPNGVVMRQTQHGLHHRPGYDLTFSAPKSVSILALVLGESSVLKAHQEALKETLVIMEAKYGASRKKKGGTELEQSGNFLWALVEEIDSRAGDPQLHTHCILLNMTQMADQSWHTIFGDPLYTDKMLCGLIYRSLLAQKLMQLGHVLRFEAQGLFEIEALPQKLLEAFSKRTEQITECMDTQGLTGGKAAQMANFQTRAHKQSVSPEQRKDQWLADLHQENSSLEGLARIVTEAKQGGPIALPDPYVLAQTSVATAIAHLSERQGTFSFQKLSETSKLMSVLPASEGDFLKAIEAQIQEKTLVYVAEKLLSTPENMRLESENNQSMQQGKATVQAMLPRWIASVVVALHCKAGPERVALNSLLQSKDQQIMIRASFGVLLDGVFKHFNKICKNQGYYPRFLVHNSLRAESLKEKLGAERVSTIEGFLSACAHRAAGKKSESLPAWLSAWDQRLKKYEAREIWIVEGALSFKEVSELQHWSQYFGARLIFRQSTKVLSPALQALEKQGMQVLDVRASLHYPEELTHSKSLLKSLASLEAKGALHCAASNAQSIDQALVLYQSLDPKQTFFLITQESLRAPLNQGARTWLKQEAHLRGEGHQIQSLQRIAFSNAQKSQAHLYQLGDVLRFSRAEVGSVIAKDSYWTIAAIDLKKNLLSLDNKAEALSINWDPTKAHVAANGLRSVEVFRSVPLEVMVGERLLWTRSVKDAQNEGGRIKHQVAVVLAIQGTILQVLLENGQKILHDASQAQGQHWDYAYALFLKQVRLQAAKHFIVLQNHTIEARSLEAFAVLLKQTQKGTQSVHWITDDQAKLQECIEQGGVGGPQRTPLEQPYARPEALAESPTTITQSVFSGLQGAYLRARELNPEFFPANLAKAQVEPVYGPLLRAACDILERTCLYHAERQAVLSMDLLNKEAALLGGAALSYTTLQAAFGIAFEKGWLVKVPYHNAEEQVVCRHSLFLEKLCVQQMIEGKDQLNPLMSVDAALLQACQGDAALSQGQKEAITLVMSTADRMVVVQGIAGSGKTTALKQIHALCQSINTVPLIIANMGSAKNQAMQQHAGIKAMTSAQFLTGMQGALSRDPLLAKKDFQHALIIVDESSMLSSVQLCALQKIVSALEVHLVLLGDFKQIGSIASGTSLYDALAYGVNKALMNENLRLNLPIAFRAMKETYQGDMSAVLHTLKDSIEEVPNKVEALERMVQLYSTMSPKQRENYVLVTPLNEDRDTVNAGVRAFLKNQGELQGNALKMRVLLPVDKRDIEKQSVHGYAISEVLRFNVAERRVHVQAGDYATVIEVDSTYHRLKLRLENGQAFYWSPKNMKKTSDVEVYEENSRELIKDDQIIFKRNHEALGIFNGDKATVLQVEAHRFEVLLLNGQRAQLDHTHSAHQHLDYAYALTPNTIQSRTIPFIIAYGVGFKARTLERQDLAVGQRIVLAKTDQGASNLNLVDSKLVRIRKIEDSAIYVQDADGKKYVITENLDRAWDYFPEAQDRRDQEFPLAMSQQQLLVMISRGDGFCMFIPSVDDFQVILERRKQHQVSALSHFDPNSAALDQGVQRLLSSIRGRAEQIEPSVFLVALPKTRAVQAEKMPRSSRQGTQTFARIDIDALNERLNSDLLGYASEWLGRPKKVSSRDARWPGTLTLKLSGDKAGAWARWSTGDKGYGLISLYAMVFDVPWKEAIKNLAELCHLSPAISKDKSQSPKRTPVVVERNLASEQAAEQARIQWAQTEYRSGVPIPGTLAEKYLREHRSIGATLPEDFRYSPALKHLDTKKLTPALMAPLRDKDQRITGMVRIFLNPDGSKLTEEYRDEQGHWDTATAKANLGVAEQSAVLIQQGLGTLWVAEGIETALSIAQALPHQQVMASTSVDRLKSIPVAADIHTVVLCADKDEAGSQSFKSIIKAVEHHLSQGKKVFIAMPQSIDKCDFNDLMQKAGVLAVQEALDRRVEIKDLQALTVGGLEALFKQQGVLEKTMLSSETIVRAQEQTAQKIAILEDPLQKTKDLDQGRER